MGMLEELAAEAGGLDLSAIGAKIGLTPEQVQAAAGQLLPQIANPGVDNQEATNAVAQNMGLDADKLASLVPALIAAAGARGAEQNGVIGSLLNGLGASADGQGGIWATISNFLDRDGDGNPLNDVLGVFQKR